MPDQTRRPTAPLGVERPTITARDPRAPVVVPIRYRYESILDFVESQSMNISRSGMFVRTQDTLPLGTILDFEFALVDGFCLLRGKAEVTRVSANPPGFGVRFRELDAASRSLVDRIVDVNSREGKQPTVAMDFADPAAAAAAATGLRGATMVISGGVRLHGQKLRVQLSPVTAGYFVHNPLLNIKLGGFVIPVEQEIPLGTIFDVMITDVRDATLFSGKGKVVAKHELRLGIRLTEADKETLARLQAEASRLAPSKDDRQDKRPGAK
jgi:uncharacterized protein (TIGR02266 family)